MPGIEIAKIFYKAAVKAKHNYPVLLIAAIVLKFLLRYWAAATILSSAKV